MTPEQRQAKVLSLLGTATDSLAQHGQTIRQRINNRVAHIDADFMAYQIAADTRDEMDGIRPMRSLEYKMRQIDDLSRELMEKVGAASYVLHCTPGGSNKGNRAAQAVQKEYQANRRDREKPEHLDIIRGAIAETNNKYGRGMAHMTQEADDGLAQAAIASVNNIICSRDKDLRMVHGMHYDMDKDEMIFLEPDDFGGIAIEEKTSGTTGKVTKKLVGYGPAYFWAQCLMGDTVDNIQGLPKVSGYDEQLRKDPELHRQNVQLYSALKPDNVTWKRIEAAWTKQGLCGQMTAFEYLKDIDNNKDAFQMVRSMFVNVAEKSGYVFKHWKTDAIVSPTVALLGDMRCLWMRHTNHEDDVMRWLRASV